MGACARQQPVSYVMDPNTGQQVPVMSQEQYAQLQASQSQQSYAQYQVPPAQPQYAPRASGSRGAYATPPAVAQQSYAQAYPQRQPYPPQTYAAQPYGQPLYGQPPDSQQPSSGDRGLANSRAAGSLSFARSGAAPSGQPAYSPYPPEQYQYPAAQYPAAAQGGPYAPAPNAYAYAPPNAQPAYTLDSGDKLRVVVFGQDGISNSYIVDAGGNVSLPLVGTVAARGFTTQQLSQMIAERLKQGYVREPHVSVEIEGYRPFFILGEVTNPGQYPYVANMTAETAVAIAGGFSPRASKKTVKLTRNMPGQQINGDVPLNFAVRPGDTLVVKERWF
jgi:polysaccharide export outer membrane protein